ncbi:succinate dehydrogenase/fumarate reductase iron-sulfur subunit [Chloroflexota bacterium]
MFKQLNVRIFRFDPESEGKPRFDHFEVPFSGKMAILDVLLYIQNYVDSTVAFRYACRYAMCGSCAVYVNGKPCLACKTRVTELRTSDITLQPLPNFPIIRDLAVDMAPFMEKWKRMKPYYVGSKEITEPVIISPGSGEREFIDDMIKCIGCGACYSACTMVATGEEFIGPAALTRAYTLIADKRDAMSIERLKMVDKYFGVWRCHAEFNCAEACPKHVVPTRAIQQLKKRNILGRFGIFRKIYRRG